MKTNSFLPKNRTGSCLVGGDGEDIGKDGGVKSNSFLDKNGACLALEGETFVLEDVNVNGFSTERRGVSRESSEVSLDTCGSEARWLLGGRTYSPLDCCIFAKYGLLGRFSIPEP